jgi:hypothetical protein
MKKIRNSSPIPSLRDEVAASLEEDSEGAQQGMNE